MLEDPEPSVATAKSVQYYLSAQKMNHLITFITNYFKHIFSVIYKVLFYYILFSFAEMYYKRPQV